MLLDREAAGHDPGSSRTTPEEQLRSAPSDGEDCRSNHAQRGVELVERQSPAKEPPWRCAHANRHGGSLFGASGVISTGECNTLGGIHRRCVVGRRRRRTPFNGGGTDARVAAVAGRGAPKGHAGSPVAPTARPTRTTTVETTQTRRRTRDHEGHEGVPRALRDPSCAFALIWLLSDARGHYDGRWLRPARPNKTTRQNHSDAKYHEGPRSTCVEVV
jgi:hypothetical protein